MTIPIVWKMEIPLIATKSTIWSVERWELALCYKWLHIDIILFYFIDIIKKHPCIYGSITLCFHNHIHEINHIQRYASKPMDKTRSIQSSFCHMVLQFVELSPNCWCTKWLCFHHFIGLWKTILLNPKSCPSQGCDGLWI